MKNTPKIKNDIEASMLQLQLPKQKALLSLSIENEKEFWKRYTLRAKIGLRIAQLLGILEIKYLNPKGNECGGKI